MEHPRNPADRNHGLSIRRLSLLALLLAQLCWLSACSSAWVRWEERERSYTVKPGDTLYQIAFRHQLDYRDIAWWNGIGRDGVIYPGQTLSLLPPLPGQLRTTGAAPQPVASAPKPQPSRRAPVTAATPVPATTTPSTVPRQAPRQPVRSPPQDASPRRWAWPVKGPVLARYNPAQARQGIDIGGALGSPIRAAAAGKVVYAGNALKGYGQLIIIKHDEEYLTAYGHNQQLMVKEGDQVKSGQTIASMGLGPQNRPLLHFEIRRQGKPTNPEKLLPS